MPPLASTPLAFETKMVVSDGVHTLMGVNVDLLASGNTIFGSGEIKPKV